MHLKTPNLGTKTQFMVLKQMLHSNQGSWCLPEHWNFYVMHSRWNLLPVDLGSWDWIGIAWCKMNSELMVPSGELFQTHFFLKRTFSYNFHCYISCLWVTLTHFCFIFVFVVFPCLLCFLCYLHLFMSCVLKVYVQVAGDPNDYLLCRPIFALEDTTYLFLLSMSWVLANVMTESSWCFWKWDRTQECSQIWVEYCIIYTHHLGWWSQ